MHRLAIWIGMLLLFSGCTSTGGRTAVVWISIDGFRHDYLDRYTPPTLTRLAREGAYTKELIPIFPSVTFPNHVAQVTGRTVDGHGVPSNTFFDTAQQREYRLPDEGTAMRAEPIWTTAKRQGVRVAVIRWPMSHAQTGPWKSDHFLEGFDNAEPDQARLDRALTVLNEDPADPAPLRLVMSYVFAIDTAGHRSGPESQEVADAVRQTDALLDSFIKSVVQWFDWSHGHTDELYILLTTDHGMQAIHTRVSLERAVGAELSAGARPAVSGPLAMLYLSGVPPDQRANRAGQIVDQLRREPFISAWTPEQIPAHLHFGDPARIGDVVALLTPGYTWAAGQRVAATLPVAPGTTPGVHGYDPAASPAMNGSAIIWRYRRPIGGKDLGPVSNTQWHATVAGWLGIRPAPGSDERVIQLP